jgi:hypothetical protein
MADGDKYLKRIEASMRLDIDLYRGGNAASPRFENVRDRDIVKFKSPSGQDMVKGLSGGISTFTAPRAERNWWWLRGGTVVPTDLTVTRDTTDSRTGITHYTIRPSSDMLLSAYIARMAEFTGVTKLELEEAVEASGRWSKA